MAHSKALRAAFCIFDFTNSNDDNSKCILDSVLEKESGNVGFIFENNEDFLGEITISYDGVDTRFTDNVYALVRNMCFRSIEQLIQKEKVKLMYFTTHGYIHLTPIDHEIHLEGDHFESVTVPYEDFIRSIFELGKRFTALFEKIATATAENIQLIKLLKADENAAFIALEKIAKNNR